MEVDDGIYRKIHICIHQFSCNTDILVAQVYLETADPSAQCLMDQEKLVWVDKIQYIQALKQIVVLSHRLSLIQPQIECQAKLKN